MIETKILTSAVGVQRNDIVDRTETTVLPSTATGVILGKFKRGRTDRPFRVTNKNFKALLGRDAYNAAYLAVEDAFERGISELWVYRIGNSAA